MKEHKADIRKGRESSNVAKHANKQTHSCDFSRAEILALETNWRRRIIKENLFTYQMQEKSLNDAKFKLNVFT